MRKAHFLSILDIERQQAKRWLELAQRLKRRWRAGEVLPVLQGYTLALLFEKPSLRTRVAFEVGMAQLGGHTVYLAPGDVQLGKRESVADVARNLSRWVQVIAARTFSHATVEELAAHASVPVINALSDREHPCQALADFLTLQEHKGRLEELQLAFVGDGNNVCHSLLLLAATLGVHMQVASPPGYEPLPDIVAQAQERAAQSGARLRILHTPQEAVRDADAVYTDVWVSMGQEAEAEVRRQVFRPYQVNEELLRYAKPDAIVLHCLPARRGEEITDEVLDGPRSVVLDQAENRLHTQKALLLALLGKEEAVP